MCGEVNRETKRRSSEENSYRNFYVIVVMDQTILTMAGCPSKEI